MDIVYVTYNSEQWLKQCFSSILASKYDLKKIKIIFVDNASTDQTVLQLEMLKATHSSKFAGFEIICRQSNSGFGIGNNLGAQIGTAPFICFFNIDTELYADSLRQIDMAVHSSTPDIAMWELHQTPLEHPKQYDVNTGKTSWCSGAAMIVRRNVFHEVQGFDPNLFMYSEDVDLSWRIRAKGYNLKYCPDILIKHHCYKAKGEIKPLEYIYSFSNNLLLRYRYGSKMQQLAGHILIYKAIIRNNPYPHSKKQLFLQYLKNLPKIKYYKTTQIRSPFLTPYFDGLQYCKMKIYERNQ